MLSFTICSNNYLSQAKVLGDSFLKYHPHEKFVIGLADNYDSSVDYSLFKDFIIIPINELKNQIVIEAISRFNIIEFNTLIKPYYFEYLFNHFDIEKIVYLDPDIKVFQPLNSLDKILDVFEVILTPHLLIMNPDDEPEFEQLVLNVGIFNLGFIALKKGEATTKLLKWWQNRLINKCYIDFANGLFVDQIWMNLIPIYIQNHYILKDPGYNVGYWNFDERLVEHREDTYYVNKTNKVFFFHFSNFNPKRPHLICKWLNYSFEKRPDLKQLYLEYETDLLNNKYVEFSNLEPNLNFKNSSKINYSYFQKFGIRCQRILNGCLNKIFRL